MRLILFHDALAADFDFSDTLFARDDLQIVRATAAELIGRCLAAPPEVVVLGRHGEFEPFDVVEEMRTHPALDSVRILLVLAELPDPRQRDALAATGTRVVKYPLGVTRVADEIADLLAVETRVAVRAAIELQVQGKSDSGVAVRGQILDLSAGGFRLRAATELKLGEILFAAFRLPDGEAPMYLSAKLVRVGSTGELGREYGFCFADARAQDRGRIAEFIGARRGLVVLPEIEGSDAVRALATV